MSNFWKRIQAPFRTGGIRRRLLVWGLTLFGLALSTVVTAGYFYMVRQIRQDAAALQSELAIVTGERIRNFVNRKIERFSDNAAALSLYPLGSKEQQLLLGLLVKNDSSFSEASVMDVEGKEVLKVSDRKVFFPSDLTDQSQSTKFARALKGEDFISGVHTSSRAQPYITLAIPMWGGAQSVIGVVAVEADLSFLWEVIGKIHFGTAGYAYLVDEQGNLIAHKDNTLVLKQMDLRQVDGVQKFLRNRKGPDIAPANEGRGLTGGQVLVTYASVPELGWAVILEEPVKTALANVEVVKRSAIAFLIIGLVVGAGIIAWVSQKITSPIQRLRRDVATIGNGNLDHRAKIKTGDEIEILADEFNKMTGALQNSHATLEQTVDQRTKEITALYEVTTAVNQSLSLKDISDAVITKIVEIFRFDSTRIFLFDDRMEELQLQASFGVSANDSSRLSFKRGQGVVGRVGDSGEPMIFEDISTDSRYGDLSATKATQAAKMKFFAVFPIKTKSRSFGAILFNARAPRRLTIEETRLLQSMSEHLAVAVEKASLFYQSERRAQQLAVLNTIGAAVSQSLDLQIVLQHAIEKMIETLRFDACWIHMLDTAETELNLQAHRGLTEEAVRTLERRKLSEGLSGKIFQTGERLVFEDFQNDIRYQQLSGRNQVIAMGFATTAGFPIKANDKTIGVLHLGSKVRRRFAADELQHIESIAQEIGVAAQNARLFTQVNQKTAELEKMNTELEEANRAKSEFISAMSHELRTPLNVIMGNAELTGEGFFGDITPEQKKAMTQVHHHSQFLLKLVNDVLALSRLDAKKMSMEIATVDIEEIMAHAQSHVEQLNRLNRLQVNWDIEPDLPQIVTDVTKLEEILQNIIGNAFKFTPRGQIDVRVRNLPESGRIEFSVTDTGIGIEPQDLNRIFGAFEQIREAHTGEYNGVGLGLNIVKKYLELMNGEIHVESHPGEGSTFTFSLPHFIPLHS